MYRFRIRSRMRSRSGFRSAWAIPAESYASSSTHPSVLRGKTGKTKRQEGKKRKGKEMKKSSLTLPDDISGWIKGQVVKADARGIVMGLSGGVDSAVVALLSKKSVRDNLLCLIMPCHSSVSDVNDAHFLADKFGFFDRFA